MRQALLEVAELHAEAATVPALEFHRVRNRSALFVRDKVSQYVDRQEELRGLPLDTHLCELYLGDDRKPDPALRALLARVKAANILIRFENRSVF